MIAAVFFWEFWTWFSFKKNTWKYNEGLFE